MNFLPEGTILVWGTKETPGWIDMKREIECLKTLTPMLTLVKLKDGSLSLLVGSRPEDFILAQVDPKALQEAVASLYPEP